MPQASPKARDARKHSKPRPPLFGCETPRIFTPPLRPLEPRSPETEERTLGYDVIDFARDVLHIELYPWRKWLLVHMLELLEDGSLRFRTVVVLVARQNGKSTLSQVLALWFMIVWGWPLVLGTAQDLETAEEVWQGAVDLVEEDAELSELLKRVVKVNGKKALELTNGTRYKVKAANRRAGRGFTGNLILLDELREHQNWEAWGAITKTTMAQLEAMVLALSNAGDLTSVVLAYLRKMAHEAVGDPDGICKEHTASGPTLLDVEALQEDGEEFDEDDLEDFEQDEDTLGLFEWSAPPGCDKWDRDGWAQANPSVGWNKGFTQRTIAAACRTDPEWVFRVECLCQWMERVLGGPFPPGAWDSCKNVPLQGPDGKPYIAEEDRIVGPVWVGVDQSHSRDKTYVAFAGFRADGVAQVEVVAARQNSDWVKGWLMDPKRRDLITAVTGQSKGAPVSPLLEDLDGDPEFTIPVVEWSGGDLTAGWANVFDSVRDRTVRTNPQEVLDIAAATAVLKTFSAGASIVDRLASPEETAPLMAFIAAKWLMDRRVVPAPPPPPKPEAVEATHVGPGSVGTDDLAHVGF
ncbi:hypothetical protein [Sinomonas sp. ASV322]|uniref:hypothetical protein n=1 Tax=Sinomonas sp. ASV322 TaxID=3041920 RepID=UPI0027DE48AB|nr:hypothetical protein [Sinomonas sp. ASV322]MDQ4502173.1 hypothetical protein [Sinomonas sp. ASV322]